MHEFTSYEVTRFYYKIIFIILSFKHKKLPLKIIITTYTKT
jgi:hypothetical protein